MEAISDPTTDLSELEARLGYSFANPALLLDALTHPSYAHERGEGSGNERLEFLGDAVLGLAIARLLYERYSDWSEGHLSRARSALVNGIALADRARALRLGEHARLGGSERQGGGAEKRRILANVFEAVVGALYLDGGLEPVIALVEREFAEGLASGDALRARDPKTRLSEWAHASRRRMPRYRVERDSGVENAEERFDVSVTLDEEIVGRGVGRTKQAAEHAAAREALARIESAGPIDD
jgi:ribonuclease III